MNRLVNAFVFSLSLSLLCAWSGSATAAPPAWQANSAIAAASGGDVTVTLPAHAANDILLLQVMVRDVNDTITWPSGWTQMATVDRGTTARYWWAWKRAASAAEPNPFVNKSTGTGDTFAVVTTYRGAITTGDPWEVKGTPNTSTAAAHVLNGITTLTAESLIVAALCGENNSAGSGTTFSATDPASLSQVLYVESATGSDGACTVGAAARTAAGATGNVTATWTNTLVGSGGIVLALKPVPPSVTSINRADTDPTTAASVSWTVTFNSSVTGVSAGNFTLVNSGLSGAPAITGVTGSGTTWTVTASTGTGTGTLGLNMSNATGVSPAISGTPFTGQVYSVRPPAPVTYYHSTINGVNIGIDGPTNVNSGNNVTIPPIITASLITTNACTGNARSNNHPTGLYTHSRWYLTTDYAVDTDISANPTGRAYLRGGQNTDTVIVRLYDYDPVSGAKVLIGSSAAITLTNSGTTTMYPYTISSALYTVPAGRRLMLQYDFNQPVATYNARVYCSAANAYITVTESPTPPPALTCFNDNFNRADGAPAGNWAVANEGGSFGNPKIVNNRLRLTDASVSVTTMAALQQLFPAAGNKIVVEFDHFAYNGSGADGMGIVLSNASIAPVAGAFGGSLGYAPKQVSAGGDTTHPGFAGGWIGVAIDEFGNFSANTEGRSGGTAPGQTTDSVAIRGSGSDYTGYPYHRGSATLAPGVDTAGATPAPGYRYRITIDHANGINAWTSVERDTGSGYVSLIPAYDAKAESGQAAVPTNWFLSFTGSTGASTNIHEIDNLQVCSTNPQPLPTLDHLRILHDGAALTCAAETVTVKACANAACDTLYLGSVTADMTNIAGATWSSDPVTFTGGQTRITLTKTTAGAVTLGTAAAGTRCFNGATETCTLTYALSSACFDAAEAGGNPSTPIYTKLSGTAFSLDVLAVNAGVINSGYTGTAVVDLVNPTAASGNCSDTNTGLTAAANYTYTAPHAGRRTLSFNYPYAAANVKVRIRDTVANQPTCSADNFAIRPQQFALSTTTALNPASNTLAAGANFNLTANPGAAVTTGYTGTPVVDTASIVDHASAAIASGAWAGSFTPVAAPGGGSAAGNFQYHEVGTIGLNADAVKDANFTAVDQVTGVVGGVDHGGSYDCVSASTSNTLASSRYGCAVGSAALGPLGRFKPDHFTLTAGSVVTRSALSCAPTSSFTYTDESMQFGFTLTAHSAAPTNRTTVKYAGAYAMLDPADVSLWPDSKLGASPSMALGAIDTPAPTPLSTRMSVTSVAAGGWAAGSNTITATAKLTRGAALDGPYGSVKLGVDPRDSDGVRLASYDLDANNDAANERLWIGVTTSFRYGRLWLGNAYGSDKLNLVMPFETQYWNGSVFVKNTSDSCTAIASANVALGNKQGGLTAYAGPVAGSSASSGAGSLTLTKPSSAAAGSVDLVVNLGSSGSPSNCTGLTGGTPAALSYLSGKWCGSSYDRDPTARATFGIYGGKRGPIYIRESY